MRFAVIGTGFAATHIAWLRSSPQATVDALCYRENRVRAVQLADQWGIPVVSDDVHDVITSGRVDAVAVVSPPDTHEEFVLAAMRAGLAVVSDKPLAHTVSAALRLAEAERNEPAAQTAVTFQWRANPAFQELRGLVGEGGLGRLIRIDVEFHHDFLGGARTAWPWRHRRDRAGAGALGDQGVHMFDLLRWLVPGDWSVVSAHALGAPRRIGRDGVIIECDTEDIAEARLRRGEDGYARVLVSRVSNGFRELRVLVQGTAATVRNVANPDNGEATLTRWSTCDSVQCKYFPPSAMNPYDLALARWSGDVSQPAVHANFGDGLAAQVLLDQALEAGGSELEPIRLAA